MAKDPWDKDMRKNDPREEGLMEEPLPTTNSPQSLHLSIVAPKGWELLAGLIYLLLHLFLIGRLLARLFGALGLSLTLAQFNLAFLSLGTVFLGISMRAYLRESFVRFRAFGRKNLWALPLGYLIRFGLSYPIFFLVMFLLQTPDVSNPNQEVVQYIIGQDFLLGAFWAIVLAPFVEEILFRGALFGPLRARNRFLAYSVSTLAFGFLHITASVFLAFSPTLLLVMLLYFPAGIALCWAYEKSGNIWTPIFLHMLMNLVALLAVTFVTL